MNLVIVLLCVNVFIAIIDVGVVGAIDKLPANITVCSRHDENLNECIKNAFQEIIPRIKYGIPELNIPPFDPFVIEKTSYQYNNGIVQGRLVMKNVHVYGMQDTVIDNIDFALQDRKMRMEIVALVPQLLIEGDYKAELKLNDLKLKPKGFFNVTMANIKMKTKPAGELYERDAHTYLRLTKFKTVPQIGNVHFYATGLVPDPAMNEVILSYINQNWRQMYKSMLPETARTWEPLMINAGNEFFAELPFDILLKNL